MLPLILFSDDTSGNKSKKWKKFDSWSVMFAGLPRHENSKLYNINFCCCLDTVSALDMTETLAPELTILEQNGVIVYDAFLNKQVIVVAPVICVLADNPRASELLNHMGSSARRYCRMCMVINLGSNCMYVLLSLYSKADKEVNPCVVDIPRTLELTLQQILNIKSQNLQKDKSELRTLYGIKEDENSMLTIPADLFQ